MSLGGDDGAARGFDRVSRLKWEVAGRVKISSVVEEESQQRDLPAMGKKQNAGLINWMV